MYRSFFTLMVLFGSLNFLFGQNLDKKSTVEGQILYEIKGDKLSLEAQCKNQTNKKLALTYKLNVAQTDYRNNSVSNSQSGKKELAGQESKTLSSTSLSWREGSRVKITLSIYHQKKLLDTEFLELPAEAEKGSSGN